MLSEIQILNHSRLGGRAKFGKTTDMKTYTSLLLILFLSLFAGRAAGQCTVEPGSGPASQTICAGDALIPIKFSFVGATTVSNITVPPGMLYSFTAPVFT